MSSTYEDLKEERQHVIQALLETKCIPLGMELFPAASVEQWELIKRVWQSYRQSPARLDAVRLRAVRESKRD